MKNDELKRFEPYTAPVQAESSNVYTMLHFDRIKSNDYGFTIQDYRPFNRDRTRIQHGAVARFTFYP